MLVLSRKINEKIVIDGNIVVTVVKIDRNQVRIGIEAPGDVRVFREEILGGIVASRGGSGRRGRLSGIIRRSDRSSHLVTHPAVAEIIERPEARSAGRLTKA